MATTFNSIPLPNASKIKHRNVIAIRDSLMLDGKHMITSNVNMGFEADYRCLGTWAQYEAVLALVGTPYTLITETETYTNCYISVGDPSESDNPGYFYFDVSFKRDTR
jgi:hypothetical protein